MHTPDVDARRMLLRERRDELARDAFQAPTAERGVAARTTEARRLRLSLRRALSWLRPSRAGSLKGADAGRRLLEER